MWDETADEEIYSQAAQNEAGQDEEIIRGTGRIASIKRLSILQETLALPSPLYKVFQALVGSSAEFTGEAPLGLGLVGYYGKARLTPNLGGSSGSSS